MVPATFADRQICILGLGYVGLTLAIAMAHKGFRVHGYEIRDDVIQSLDKGVCHFHEPGLDERLRKVIANGTFTWSKNIAAATEATVFILTVGTPLDKDGHARLDMVSNAARQVASIMPDGSLVILRSTVKIGTGRNVVMPILAATGKRFEIAACPERTLEGRALIELNQLPQIIGSDEPQTQHRAAQVFNFLTPTTIRVSKLETAEMIKLVDNTSRDVGFAFANEIARACDALGLSAAEVIRSGKLGYPRTNLPMPGPVGGPCLEKDPHILRESLAAYKIDMPITGAARQINESQPEEIATFIAAELKQRQPNLAQSVVTLMGLAFKGQPETDDLRGTMARPILDALKAKLPGTIWRGYDPVVSESEIRNFGLTPADSIAEAVAGSHAVLILNNHTKFQAMPIEDLASTLASGGFFYDCWNFFSDSQLQLPPRTAYFALGSQKCGQLSQQG